MRWPKQRHRFKAIHETPAEDESFPLDRAYHVFMLRMDGGYESYCQRQRE